MVRWFACGLALALAFTTGALWGASVGIASGAFLWALWLGVDLWDTRPRLEPPLHDPITGKFIPRERDR